MKRFVVVGAAIVVLGIAGVALQWRGHSPERAVATPTAVAPPATSPSTLGQPAAAPTPLSAPDEDAPCSTNAVADRPRVFASAVAPKQVRLGQGDPVLQRAHQSLREYQQAFRQNPVGNNAEITRALLGKNPRSTRFLPQQSKLNERGEIIDAWDQPLFFHQISATNMEIRSAGPDRAMWTADDEVLR